MSVPDPAPPAKASESAGHGSLKMLGSAAVAVAAVALAVTVAVQVMPRSGRDDGPTRSPAAEPLVAAARIVTHAVLYELLGEPGVRNVTYVAQGAAIVQEPEAATPWSASFRRTGVDGGEFYSVSAQSTGRGTLRCRIMVDGLVVSEKSVSGDHSMVTCAR